MNETLSWIVPDTRVQIDMNLWWWSIGKYGTYGSTFSLYFTNEWSSALPFVTPTLHNAPLPSSFSIIFLSFLYLLSLTCAPPLAYLSIQLLSSFPFSFLRSFPTFHSFTLTFFPLAAQPLSSLCLSLSLLANSPTILINFIILLVNSFISPSVFDLLPYIYPLLLITHPPYPPTLPWKWRQLWAS